MNKYRVSFAQNREDIILRGFFNEVKKGFYVDVGANHPEELSITKNFYDAGWSGINVEPNKHLFSEISKVRTRDINLNIGVADKEGKLTFREYKNGDGLSTFKKESQNIYEGAGSEYHQFTRDYTDRLVEVKTLEHIFEEHASDKQINFLNIDVEGFEYEVISSNDWKRFRPQVICVEANHIIKDWRPLLKKAEYSLGFFDGLNEYYVADEHSAIKYNFSYAKSVLMEGPIMPATIADDIAEIEGVVARQEDRLLQQRQTIHNLQDEVLRLNQHIAAQNRLRASIKHLVMVVDNIILLNIDKLNRPSKPKFRPLPDPDTFTDPIHLNSVLRQYDLDTYYNLRKGSRLFYRIIRKLYKSLRHLLFGIMRSLYRIVRKVISR